MAHQKRGRDLALVDISTDMPPARYEVIHCSPEMIVDPEDHHHGKRSMGDVDIDREGDELVMEIAFEEVARGSGRYYQSLKLLLDAKGAREIAHLLLLHADDILKTPYD